MSIATADTPGLPFAHINLRRNPFGEVEVARRPEFAITDVDRWVPELVGRTAVQFMGDKGRGKTTHLVALLRHCPAGAYVHVPEDGPRPALPVGCPLFIDEAQRVPWWARRRVYRRGVPLVLGTHRDLRGELRRAGFRVITVYPGQALDVDRLLTLVNRRIAWARRGPGAVPRVGRVTATDLLRRHGTDLRAIEGDLYDRFQHLHGVCDV